MSNLKGKSEAKRFILKYPKVWVIHLQKMNYKDYSEVRLKAATHLIESGYFKSLNNVFISVSRKAIATKSCIGYRRFLNLIKKPDKMTCLEIERVASVLNTKYEQMLVLIENQNKIKAGDRR